MNIWDDGDAVVMEVTFLDPNSNVEPVDPETNYSLIDPDDVFLTFAISTTKTGTFGTPTVFTYTAGNEPSMAVLGRLSQGIYQVWVDSTGQPGYWTYRGYSLGTGQATDKNQLYVRPKAF